MKNFIRFNIENVAGKRKPSSFLEGEPRSFSNQKTKPKYPVHHHRSIENRVKDLENEVTYLGDKKNDSAILG